MQDGTKPCVTPKRTFAIPNVRGVSDRAEVIEDSGIAELGGFRPSKPGAGPVLSTPLTRNVVVRPVL